MYVRNVEVHLTPTEFRLLAYLLEHAGQLVKHRQVLASVWRGGYGADVHLLRMTIRNLRQKLKSTSGDELAAFEANVRALYKQMARITITPTWARYYDFGAGRLPTYLRRLVDSASS